MHAFVLSRTTLYLFFLTTLLWLALFCSIVHMNSQNKHKEQSSQRNGSFLNKQSLAPFEPKYTYTSATDVPAENEFKLLHKCSFSCALSNEDHCTEFFLFLVCQKTQCTFRLHSELHGLSSRRWARCCFRGSRSRKLLPSPPRKELLKQTKNVVRKHFKNVSFLTVVWTGCDFFNQLDFGHKLLAVLLLGWGLSGWQIIGGRNSWLVGGYTIALFRSEITCDLNTFVPLFPSVNKDRSRVPSAVPSGPGFAFTFVVVSWSSLLRT